jgi:hypothetical protein
MSLDTEYWQLLDAEDWNQLDAEDWDYLMLEPIGAFVLQALQAAAPLLGIASYTSGAEKQQVYVPGDSHTKRQPSLHDQEDNDVEDMAGDPILGMDD